MVMMTVVVPMFSIARDAIAEPIETSAIVEVAPVTRDGITEPVETSVVVEAAPVAREGIAVAVETSVVVPSKCRTGYRCHHKCDYQKTKKKRLKRHLPFCRTE
jgi:hypothetical protein